MVRQFISIKSKHDGLFYYHAFVEIVTKSRRLSAVIQVRKLVAVELTFLGPKIIIAEYAVAVVVGLAVGVLSLRAGLFRGHSIWQAILGIYLFLIVLTYAVLMAFAIAMARGRDWNEEIADELHDPKAVMRKYRRQSLWIIVPLAIPVAAVRQERKRAV